ncbi:hypothetical protein [Sphingopyxis sp. NJF-3]
MNALVPTPGSNPLPSLAGATVSVPADRPVAVSRGVKPASQQGPSFPVVQGNQPGPGNGTHILLSQPFIAEDLSDEEGPIFVASPLKYLRFDRDSGCVVDHPVHSKPPSRRP